VPSFPEGTETTSNISTTIGLNRTRFPVPGFVSDGHETFRAKSHSSYKIKIVTLMLYFKKNKIVFYSIH